jgi:hypothetical protein
VHANSSVESSLEVGAAAAGSRSLKHLCTPNWYKEGEYFADGTSHTMCIFLSAWDLECRQTQVARAVKDCSAFDSVWPVFKLSRI